MKMTETQKKDWDLKVMNAELGGNAPCLDLHGRTQMEAETLIDQFLSREFYAGTEVVKIEHGRGTGAMQKLAEREVSAHPLVLFWRKSESPRELGSAIYCVLS